MAVAEGSRPSLVTARPLIGRLAIFLGCASLSFLACMVAWILVPMIFLGWTPLVITSGSMEPLIKPGDIVLVEPTAEAVGPGTVVAFDDGNGTVVHRVDSVSDSGDYVTKGDANRGLDSTPVSGEQVIGSGRLLVPYLGLVRVVGGVWWAAMAGGVALAIVLWRRRTGVATFLALLLMTVVGIATANSVFAHTTTNTGSSIETMTVQPPTNFVAECTPPLGLGDVAVALSWDASPTTGVTGYQILHDAPGGGVSFVEVGSVGPSMTEFTHEILVSLLGLGTHTYAVRAKVGSWDSANSATDAVAVTQVVIFICSDQ